MKNIWFTADTHFGHRKIALYTKRYFCLNDKEKELLESSSIKAGLNWKTSLESTFLMDDCLINKINELVKENDILWHLGDFCVNLKNKNVAEIYRNRINCKNVFLISGNHDKEKTKSIFNEVFDYKEIKVFSKYIMLSHYAQVFWHKSHNGAWMLYGHAHGAAERWLEETMPERLSMDVGVDNVFKIFGEYRPISFDEISKLFSSRRGFFADRA